jgi:predicted N-acyltransferase
VTKDSITARVAGPASEIGAAAWNACANPDAVADPHPFTRYEFFAACEESGSATARTGWKPAHLVVEDGGRVVALLPTYLKNHSQGEYVFDSAWADALERSGGDYYPKLQASVPFTPVTGSRLLVSADTGVAAGREALLATGATAVRQQKASSFSFWANCRRRNAKICARSARPFATPASNSTG